MNRMLHCEIIIVLCCVCVFAIPLYDDDAFTNPATAYEWRGKWFPHAPGKFVIDDNPVVDYNPKSATKDIHDSKHGIAMGIRDPSCDDGKTNLSIDWNSSPINYTCYDNKNLYLPSGDVSPILECEHIPVKYSAQHKCMDEAIHYDEILPTFGTHRPLWPKYGEYRFVPKQRWLHSLEHGAIVMLYHPCANAYEVDILRRLVTGCLYRHIITPYDQLDPERPLALVSWGCSLRISKVDPNIVTTFITEYALRGPEKNSRDGQFDKELLHPAKIISNVEDDDLCPGKNM